MCVCVCVCVCVDISACAYVNQSASVDLATDVVYVYVCVVRGVIWHLSARNTHTHIYYAGMAPVEGADHRPVAGPVLPPLRRWVPTLL